MDMPTPDHDLFDEEHRALLEARAAYDACETVDPHRSREALGQLAASFERLLRETRRLVRRSDRAEREMNALNQQLQALASELEHRATHDPLTGVLNRAAVIDTVNATLTTDGLALVVLDIDHFKRINDSFGHPVGDTVIVGVVACLQPFIPTTASIGRVGGEEFTVLLPATDMLVAVILAESMRAAIAGHAFALPDGSAITASFGVSWTARTGTFDQAYLRADEALYAAKRGGRNQVACAAPMA